MFQAVSGLSTFAAGYMCHSHCTDPPCTAQLAPADRPFKLCVQVHAAHLDLRPGPLTKARPLVRVAVGDKAKETEPGDWSEDTCDWSFGETIILEVSSRDELLVSVFYATRYELFVATISTRSTCLGALSLPVASILQRLRWEDRDAAGMILATPVLGFDVVQDGRLHGTVQLSFATRSAPPPLAKAQRDECCGNCGVDPDVFAPRQTTSDRHGNRAEALAPSSHRNDLDSSRFAGKKLPHDWWEHFPVGGDSGDDALFLPPWARGIDDGSATNAHASTQSSEPPDWRLSAYRYARLGAQ
mmetsp:Transcript_117969/g.333668  ORF Transcript_117969/g.333668 Transcript_117969/m.333668 type:complete len:300 (-) Transcript_117969:68-967(-)